MFIPESPAWLVSKGKIEQAGKSLDWLYKYHAQPEHKVWMRLAIFLQVVHNWIFLEWKSWSFTFSRFAKGTPTKTGGTSPIVK